MTSIFEDNARKTGKKYLSCFGVGPRAGGWRNNGHCLGVARRPLEEILYAPLLNVWCQEIGHCPCAKRNLNVAKTGGDVMWRGGHGRARSGGGRRVLAAKQWEASMSKKTCMWPPHNTLWQLWQRSLWDAHQSRCLRGRRSAYGEERDRGCVCVALMKDLSFMVW